MLRRLYVPTKKIAIPELQYFSLLYLIDKKGSTCPSMLRLIPPILPQKLENPPPEFLGHAPENVFNEL